MHRFAHLTFERFIQAMLDAGCSSVNVRFKVGVTPGTPDNALIEWVHPVSCDDKVRHGFALVHQRGEPLPPDAYMIAIATMQHVLRCAGGQQEAIRRLHEAAHGGPVDDALFQEFEAAATDTSELVNDE